MIIKRKSVYFILFRQGGDVHDSVRFILDNLGEMNKLWIRIQGNKEKTKREKERIDLKVTVGENLHRLSSLEGVTIEIYQNVVLPKMLDMVNILFLKLFVCI